MTAKKNYFLEKKFFSKKVFCHILKAGVYSNGRVACLTLQ